jgi:hypothetical protein
MLTKTTGGKTMDNLDEYRMEDDPEWLEWYWANEAKEREQKEPAYTPGDRWSDPMEADPDALLINWL